MVEEAQNKKDMVVVTREQRGRHGQEARTGKSQREQMTNCHQRLLSWCVTHSYPCFV